MTTRAWLYVRGERSVRIVMEKCSLAVYGPGLSFRREDYTDGITVMLEHSRIEQELVRDGWSLEQMTTERRSGLDRPRGAGAVERRRGLRLVGAAADHD